MLIFDLHNSLSFKIRTCTWSSLNENEAWKLNVHNTSASFSFNFDHVHVLILNDYAWFWIILNHIMDVHVTEIECKWSVNVQEGPQFCYILIAKVVGISHTWGLSFDSWDWVLSSMRTNFFESQGIIKRNKENYYLLQPWWYFMSKYVQNTALTRSRKHKFRCISSAFYGWPINQKCLK